MLRPFLALQFLAVRVCLPLLLLWPSPAVSQTPVLAAAPQPSPTCPPCFNCETHGCQHYAPCSNGICQCPPGFGGQDCRWPTGNSTNLEPRIRAIHESADASSAAVVCDDGFEGHNCNVCSRDDVCLRRPGDSVSGKFICNKSPKAWKVHHTFCSIEEPLLDSIYSGSKTVTIMRNMTSGTLLGTIWYEGRDQFSCKMSNCTQITQDDSIEYSCLESQCTCFPDSSFCGGPGGKYVDFTTPLSRIQGGTSFSCPRDNPASCNFRIKYFDDFFPKGLILANCKMGECALPADEPPDLRKYARNYLTPAEKAGIAIAISVVILAALLLLYAKIKQNRLRRMPKPSPRTGVNLAFSNISYSVKEKNILHGVSGEAKAGKVLAIMGPSGSGKSTLLEILARKSKNGSLSGDMLVDGNRMPAKKFRRIAGYVDQEDILMDTLSVEETIMFSARLRLPESVSDEEKYEAVVDTIKQLGLSHVAHSRIGGNGVRGISGGEKRRVSVGVELVTSPSIIFLDEPTSGLDSYNAHLLVQTLASLAHDSGKTIVFTIHQPRSDVYQLFDEVFVLARGECMYYGDAKEASSYFAYQGRPCPEGYNIADHLLDLAIAHEYEGDFQSNLAKNPDLDLDRKSIDKQKLPIQIFGPNSDFNTNDSSVTLNKQGSIQINEEYVVSFFTQITELTKRSFKVLIRKSSLLVAHIFVALILGLYWHSGNAFSGLQNRLGSIFFILALVGFSSISAIGVCFFLWTSTYFTQAFTEERLLFMRERSNGFYGPTPFLLTKVLFDLLPLRLIPSAILGSIAYFMIGYVPEAENFVKFLIMIFLFASACGLFCLAIGSAVRDVGTANLVASIVLLFKMLLAGFLINSNAIPMPLRWIQYLSFFKYTYEALVVNDLATLQVVDNISGIEVNIPASIVLQKFGLDLDGYFKNLIVSCAIVALLLLVNTLLIVFRLKERK